jgi:FdhD protein
VVEQPSRSRLIEVRRFTGEGVTSAEVPVIREIPLTLFHNGREIITLLTTPGHLDELAVGFLRSEGFLSSPADLIGLEVDEEAGTARVEGRSDDAFVTRLMERRTITSGCGKGTTFYHATDALTALPAEDGARFRLGRVVELVAEVNRLAMSCREAGGVHHAALCSEEGVVIIREDVGRHNAIDKIQGHCFLSGTATRDKILVSTGRISSEILVKAAKMGVPLVVSLSKPSTLALELAERLRMTVVGNVRGRSGYVYLDFGRLDEEGP